MVATFSSIDGINAQVQGPCYYNTVVYLLGKLGTLYKIFQRDFKTLTLKAFFLNTLIGNGFHTNSMVMRQLGKIKGSDIRLC